MPTFSLRFMSNPLVGYKTLNRTTQLYLSFSLIGAMVLPIILTGYDHSYYQVLLATLLIIVCLYPTARYFARKESGIPTMGILCLAYALQFGLPIFTRDATFELMDGEVRFLNDADVIAALLVAITGVCLLQLGYYRFRASHFAGLVPSADLPLNRFRAILYCLVVGFVLPLVFSIRDVIPEEYQAPLSSTLTLLQNQILVVIAILGWLVYSQRGSRWFVVALYGGVGLAALRGVGNGSMSASVGLLPLPCQPFRRVSSQCGSATQ